MFGPLFVPKPFLVNLQTTANILFLLFCIPFLSPSCSSRQITNGQRPMTNHGSGGAHVHVAGFFLSQKEEFLERVSVMFGISRVEKEGKKKPDRAREIGMCLKGDWYRLEIKDRTFPQEDPVRSLDIQVRLFVHYTVYC